MWAGDAVDASNLCCDSQGKIQSVIQRCSISVCPQILLVVSWWWDSFMGVWFDHLKHQGKSEFLVCDLSHEWGKFQGTALPTSSVDTCQWQQARLKTRHLLQFLCLQLAPSSQSSPSPVSFSGLGQLLPPIQRVPKPNVPCATETLWSSHAPAPQGCWGQDDFEIPFMVWASTLLCALHVPFVLTTRGGEKTKDSLLPGIHVCVNERGFESLLCRHLVWLTVQTLRNPLGPLISPRVRQG